MLILIGKSGSGKDTICNQLIQNYGYKKIVTYTTRPIRKDEVEGVSYHYINNEEFMQKVNDGFFAEYRKYETVNGVWYYGSALEDYENSDDKTVIILTPSGVKEVKEKLDVGKITIIYLDVDDEYLLKRLSHRGDDPGEIIRRMNADEVDFNDVYEIADVVINNTYRSVEETLNIILRY